MQDSLRIASVYTPAAARPATLALFALDARLAGIVAHSGEPMLGQMRLAWWRDALRQSPDQRPRGDEVLDDLGAAWGGEEIGLTELVDGWESLLGDWRDEEQSASRFADGRATAFRQLARTIGANAQDKEIDLAARRWALVDLAGKVSRPDEREDILTVARTLPDLRANLPRALRPLAVLDGLARRALARNSSALLGDRLSPFAAMRLGIIGR